MQLTYEIEDRMAVIHLEGKMTHDVIGPFTELVVKCLSENVCDFMIDASALDFVDSKALETLLWLKGVAQEQLGQICLVATTPEVLEILRLTRLESEFALLSNKGEALASLS